MTPENNTELHLRTVAELAVIRALLSSLCRQMPDAQQLREEFEQRLEEIRHAEQVRTGQVDHQFEKIAGVYLRSVLLPDDRQKSDLR